MNKETIVIIKTCNRKENVDSLQKVLTEYGCFIKTRLGLHNAGNICSDDGLIILQLIEDSDVTKKLEYALDKLDGIIYKCVRI